MLQLKNICKEYITGEHKVQALRGVDLSFRRSEFVAVLGQSGCGKTTLLNIIGGLDRYSEGDLIIKGRSTKEYKDRDWDSYRNHSVGFVFQSYNLIPHQNVLSNVELALTLSGVSLKERRKRAIEVLNKVGLGDQLHKRPNEMSGGQMQRVAIARALINNPEILLADEPTGALDSETSVQIMEILKEIAKDRLVIMVTHNPELAEQYATRTIRLLDGKVISDSDPYDAEKEGQDHAKTMKHTAMGFTTALRLSLNNLMTKKGRTFMIALAGSIGIIGIALILSLSNGVNLYIKGIEEDTLSLYPLTIQSETVDSASMMMGMMALGQQTAAAPEEGRIHSSNIMGEMLNTMVSEVNENDLAAFKKFIDTDTELQQYLNGVGYEYSTVLNIYNENAVNGVQQVNPSTLIDNMTNTTAMSDMTQLMNMSSMSSMGSMAEMYNLNAFFELPQNKEDMSDDYAVIAGRLPEKYNELLLVVGKNNDLSDMTLYTLGMRDQGEVQQMFMSLMTGGRVGTEATSYSYEELLDMKFKLVLQGYMYKKGESGIFADMRGDEQFMAEALKNGIVLNVVGIARGETESLVSMFAAGGIGYTRDLVEYVINANNETAAVKAQRENPQVDIFTGVLFGGGVAVEPSMELLNEYLNTLPAEQQASARMMMRMMSEEQLLKMMKEQMAKQTTTATYDGNISLLNAVDPDTPTSILLYPVDFASKEEIVRIIEAYNERMTKEGKDGCVIRYTDYVGTLMSSVTTIVDVISYVLIAFVSISLVVSSIMIGIITYISVLERTKEIGILRAMGASKRDVSRVFTAETFIIGLCAGALGVLVTWGMTFPINAVIRYLTGIRAAAVLPWQGAVILVIVSMILTMIAGFLPSRMAARKDPVVALRTE